MEVNALKRCIQVFLLLICATCTTLQAQSPSSSDRVESILGKMSLEEKIDYIGGTGFAIRAMPSLQLPAFEMSDGPLGVRSNSRFPSTVYAAGIGLAATWNRSLAEKVGGGIGRDARARGLHFMLGPGVNIYRSPRNGRNFEYFGEDPFLASNIAVGYITGMQAQGVSATIKHFLANNSEFLRHDSDSIVDERTLREISFPPSKPRLSKPTLVRSWILTISSMEFTPLRTATSTLVSRASNGVSTAS